MTCPLVRIRFWSLPLLLCGDQCVFWALVKMLLIWVPLYLSHRCSELKLFWIFPLRKCSVCPHLAWKLLVESLFYWILGWQLCLFLGSICLEDFFPFLLWDSVFVIEVCFLYEAKFWILFVYQVCCHMSFYRGLEFIYIDSQDRWLLVPGMFPFAGGFMFLWLSCFCFLVR